MIEEVLKEIENLYPEYKIYGPYPRKSDGRYQLVLSKGKAKITKLYAKFVMEAHLKRILSKEETIDHINNDRLDDRLENLQILSREQNARKSALGNQFSLGRKQRDGEKRSGEKNGKAKLNNLLVEFYRVMFYLKILSKKDIVNKTGLSSKAVYSFIYGLSYKNAKFKNEKKGKKLSPKKRNPFHNHPKLTKGGKHRKLRKRDQQNKERQE